jgi:hypothetical protein
MLGMLGRLGMLGMLGSPKPENELVEGRNVTGLATLGLAALNEGAPVRPKSLAYFAIIPVL